VAKLFNTRRLGSVGVDSCNFESNDGRRIGALRTLPCSAINRADLEKEEEEEEEETQ